MGDRIVRLRVSEPALMSMLHLTGGSVTGANVEAYPGTNSMLSLALFIARPDAPDGATEMSPVYRRDEAGTVTLERIDWFTADGSQVPEGARADDMSWLAHLGKADVAEFIADVQRVAYDPPALRQCLRAWRVTAEALSDPARREVLTGAHDPADFTEVQRPGGEDA